MEGTASPSIKLLLVEDSEESVALFRTFLLGTDFDLTVTTDGEKGLSAFQDNPFSMVLMDIVLPGLDGCSIARAMRHWEKENSLPRTPIAAVTALRAPNELSRIGFSGCSTYLQKPITKERLLRTVRKFIGETSDTISGARSEA